MLFYPRGVVTFSVFLLLSGCFSVVSRYDGPVRPYAVKDGETLAAISQRFGVSLDSIIEMNEIDQPNELEIGQIIYLPESVKASWVPSKNMPSADRPPLVADLNYVKNSPAAKQIGKLWWPVEEGKLGSKFGARSGSFHEGIDIRAELGNSIFAAHEGTVVFSGKLWAGYGNMIILKGKDFYTVYAHNNRNFVDDGDEVEQGEEIATVGMSGNASGPHLHFEVRIDDSRGYKIAVNPLIFLKSQKIKVL